MLSLSNEGEKENHTQILQSSKIQREKATFGFGNIKKERTIKSNVALVPIHKNKKKKVLGHDIESELVCFVKFGISGVLKVALLSFKSSTSHGTLKTSKRLSDKKLSFCFCNLGDKLSGMRPKLADRSGWKVSSGGARGSPPWDHTNNQLPSTGSCSRFWRGGGGTFRRRSLPSAVLAWKCAHLDCRLCLL